jgi:DNA polymerase II
MAQPNVIEGFVLTREWRDGPSGTELRLWCWTPDGATVARIHAPKAVCFIGREAKLPDGVSCDRRSVELVSPSGDRVDALYFSTQRALTQARERAAAQGIRLFESDVRGAERYLMERFIRGGIALLGPHSRKSGRIVMDNPKTQSADVYPALNTVSLDIETDGFEGELLSVALVTPQEECVLLNRATPPPKADIYIDTVPDEPALLHKLVQWFERADPDVIIGWNLIGFDLQALERRFAAHSIPFSIGRAGERARILPGSRSGQPAVALIPGRVAIDGIEHLRAAFWTFEDWTLDGVGNELLGRGKLIDSHTDKLAAIRALYAEDPVGLARYNLEDSRLVAEIVAHTGLIDFTIQRTRLTGLALGRLGGSVASLDNLYLPRLHRRGRVAHDIGDNAASGAGSPGGHVLDSTPGLYRNVALLDFKSLYPSIMRTFRIDPLGLWAPGADPVEGFLGAQFARDGAILPALIDDLWDARDAAKAQRNAPLSQAIKIIMNAFYGVLASTGCRFYDPRLASSITRRGHEVLKRSRDYLADRGLHVIYGDTDSLFVALDDGLSVADARLEGQSLARELNAWWDQNIADEHRVTSCLEVEFETLFSRFLMPTLRGSELGSKKRYAGVAAAADESEELIFKGLESVRTDWTPLARRFQRELYARIFKDEPFEDFVRDTLEAMRDGQFDDELIYRKRLRRNVDEYTASSPPHVQAARIAGVTRGWVRYVITLQGPRPADQNDSALDYEHYKTKQLAPVADGVLRFAGTSFDMLTDKQLQIF